MGATHPGPRAPAPQPTARAVRRLRGFARSFEAQVAATERETGIRFEVSRPKLTAAFLDWLAAFERQRAGAGADRMAFVGFAAGLMLRSLVEHDPARARALPPGADLDRPAFFWPEGHLYTAYCLNVRGVVLEEEFAAHPARPPELDDIRAWWSFRETVRDDPAQAVAFLDLFSGAEPDWSTPGLFRDRRFRRLARRAVPGAER